MPQMHEVSSAEELWALVGEPTESVIKKELPELDERAAGFISSSPFLVMATAAADGSADASPKGGPPGFVRVLDTRRLAIPEFPGNRRFDGVHNLLDASGIGLLFIVPGITETLRVNGVARVTRDPELVQLWADERRLPWYVVDVEVRQVFSHCSRAFLRSHLWKPEQWPDPDRVTSPSRTISERARTERRSEKEIRRDVDNEYETHLY